MPVSKDRQAASHYPFPLTHVIGLFFFLSSFIVAAILCYFIYYLRQDNIAVPLELIFPLVVAILSLVSLAYQFFTHTFRVSHARTNFLFNIGLFALWTTSLGLTSWKLGHMVLSHACTTVIWQTDMGVMVCRIYKAFYAFTVIGWIAAGAAFVLDWRVSSEQTSRGVYQQMKDDSTVLQRGLYVEMKGEQERLTPRSEYTATPKM